MAISFVASGTVGIGTGTTVTVNVPAGYQENDFLIIAVSSATVAPVTPTGWTLYAGQTTTTPRIYVYCKYATSSESSVSVSVSSAAAIGVMLAYRGVSTIDSVSTSATATSTTITTNSLTTSQSNDYVVSFFNMTTGAATWTAPGSTTTRVNSAGLSASNGLLIVDELQAAAGASATRTATSSVSKALSAVSFSLIPSGTRYWVGGAGSWDTTRTNWSLTSGGSSGASAPSQTDSVVFDQAGTYTVTCTGALTCLDITVSAGTVTFAQGTSPTFTISGSMSLIAGTVWSATGSITFNATTTGKTVTTNGVSISGSIIFNGAGGAWTLGSPLTLASFVQVTAGTFDTSSINNYSVSCSQFGLNGTIARTVNLNGSTLTCSIASTSAFNASTITNLTFNAGTSQINLSGGSTSGISSSGLTFNNVSFTSAIATTIAITGANTFNTLSFAGRTSTGITAVTFSANQTISTLTLNAGTAAAYRTFLASDTIGTQRTLSVGTLTAGAADYDFRDIAITGAAAPLTGTRFGDCKGNSGITFPAAKTVYYRQVISTNWGQTGTGSWSATSGGSLDATQFPLAQDTAIFPSSTYPAAGTTTTINANYNIGTIDMSARTANTMTLATGTTTPQIYGNWINGTGITLTGTGTLTFAGRGSQTITSAGVTFVQNMTFNNPGGSVTLLDAFTNTGSTSSAFALTQGDFSAASYNVSLPNIKFAISGSATRTLDFGSGTWSIGGTGGTAFVNSATNLTVTGTGVISMTGATAKTFQGGGIQTYPTINQGGAGALTITGNNSFADITNTYSATGATTISFAAGTQTVSQFTASGTSGNLLTLNSSITGTQRTLTLTGGGTVSTNYLNVQDIAFTPGPATDGTTPYVWYLGANSTNSGNNTGGAFVASTTKVYQITNTATTSWTVPSDWNSSSNTIHLIGGGGGGGGSRSTSTTNKAGGAGGGGGGYTAVTNYSTTPSSSIAVAVGTGGTAGGASGGTGGTGGTTSWAVTNLATGGTGGSTTAVPTSVGGLGGMGTFSGGAGGAGSTTTTSGVIVTGGGGGGAAGPNGAGGAGGIGFANATAANTAGGGGGGNGGGTAGGNASSATGGTGGNNSLGTGGGASNTAGSIGGGGGGSAGSNATRTGGTGIDILNTIGGGGGTGGAATSAAGAAGGAGVVYGAGGSGATTSSTITTFAGGAGAQGLIVIAYTPGAVVTSTGNFFLMFT